MDCVPNFKGPGFIEIIGDPLVKVVQVSCGSFSEPGEPRVDFILSGKEQNTYAQVSLPSARQLSIQAYPADRSLLHNKTILEDLLSRAGIPVLDKFYLGVSLANPGQFVQAMTALKWPECVVGSIKEHVRRAPESLTRSAFAAAARQVRNISPRLLALFVSAAKWNMVEAEQFLSPDLDFDKVDISGLEIPQHLYDAVSVLTGEQGRPGADI